MCTNCLVVVCDSISSSRGGDGGRGYTAKSKGEEGCQAALNKVELRAGQELLLAVGCTCSHSSK